MKKDELIRRMEETTDLYLFWRLKEHIINQFTDEGIPCEDLTGINSHADFYGQKVKVLALLKGEAEERGQKEEEEKDKRDKRRR